VRCAFAPSEGRAGKDLDTMAVSKQSNPPDGGGYSRYKLSQVSRRELIELLSAMARRLLEQETDTNPLDCSPAEENSEQDKMPPNQAPAEDAARGGGRKRTLP
jgi:hypothetical protein